MGAEHISRYVSEMERRTHGWSNSLDYCRGSDVTDARTSVHSMTFIFETADQRCEWTSEGPWPSAQSTHEWYHIREAWFSRQNSTKRTLFLSKCIKCTLHMATVLNLFSHCSRASHSLTSFIHHSPPQDLSFSLCAFSRHKAFTLLSSPTESLVHY